MSEEQQKDYRRESRLNYTSFAALNANGVPCFNGEQLKIGAILRIADSVEKMAENYDRIISDRNMYKRWYENEQEKHAELKRKYRALKGQLTKCKKQINNPR